jgi:hypothetical protein
MTRQKGHLRGSSVELTKASNTRGLGIDVISEFKQEALFILHEISVFNMEAMRQFKVSHEQAIEVSTEDTVPSGSQGKVKLPQELEGQDTGLEDSRSEAGEEDEMTHVRQHLAQEFKVTMHDIGVCGARAEEEALMQKIHKDNVRDGG